MKQRINNWQADRRAKKEAKKSKPNDMTDKDYERLGRSVEQVYATGYASKGRMFYMSFVKGIGYGFGIFIGGTIVVGIVLSLLTTFAEEEVPVLGPLAEKINNSIQKGSEADIEEIQKNIQTLQQQQQQ